MDKIDEERQKAIQEQTLQKQREAANQQKARESFQRVVAQVQKTATINTKQNQQQRQQNNSARQALNAKRGIAYTHSTEELLHQNDTTNKQWQKQTAKKATTIADADVQQHQQLSHEAIARDERQQQQSGQGKQQHQHQQQYETANIEAAFLPQGAVTMEAIDGISNKAESASGSSQAHLSHIIDDIVKAVYTGVNAEGFGMIHIELKEDALQGTNLTIHATAQGVRLKIVSPDTQVANLIRSSATELNQALGRKGIVLQGLEVNEHKVIAS